MAAIALHPITPTHKMPGTERVARDSACSRPTTSSGEDDVDTELDDEGVDAFIDCQSCLRAQVIRADQLAQVTRTDKYARTRLFAAFAIFGLLNNGMSPQRIPTKPRVDCAVLYVIILSAALDLVPPSTPKGIVAFFNIFPALLAKVVWPLVSNGQIRYGRRVGFCTCASWTGIVVRLDFWQDHIFWSRCSQLGDRSIIRTARSTIRYLAGIALIRSW